MTARVVRLPMAVFLGLTILLAWLHMAAAQNYPDRPVRLIVPFPAGGPTDTLGRILAERLSERWRQPVIVENRGGAGGNIGAALVARAAPDGYTLLLNASSHVINASLSKDLPYDPIRDFTAISELASYMLLFVVHPSVPAKSLNEFVDFARSRPDGLVVANAGSGTPSHLAAVLFAEAARLNFVHLSYRGAAPATSDLLAGHALAMFNNPVNSVPQVKADGLRALAVTGSQRLTLLPDVPTIAEVGYPDFEARTWYGLLGPANMTPEQVAGIFADTRWALGAPDVADKLVAQGWDIVVSSPAAFARVLQSELDRWSTVVRNAEIKQAN
jgi:tripartite-type tricarboxylate transporter receptor subunit TctC